MKKRKKLYWIARTLGLEPEIRILASESEATVSANARAILRARLGASLGGAFEVAEGNAQNRGALSAPSNEIGRLDFVTERLGGDGGDRTRPGGGPERARPQ